MNQAIDTSTATALARTFDQAGFSHRLLLVETLPVVVLGGGGAELPIVFHADDLPGLLFVPYRADSLMGRLDDVLEHQPIAVRRISVSEPDYLALMEAVDGGVQLAIESFIERCCPAPDHDMDNIAD